MQIKDIIKGNRSYRRFYQEKSIELEDLKEWIDLARLSASAANLQPLKYIISNEPDKNEKIFKTLKWAGYLKDWNGPEEGEKPSAYIVISGDSQITKNIICDHGIASQSILMGAREKGYGGCILAAITRDELRGNLKIPDQYEILLVIALGKPKEEVVLEEVGEDGNIQYWRDENRVHHVPKRKLEDIILDI
jgi:nitroreductase